MSKGYLIGYGLVLIYMLVPYLLLGFNSIEPIIFGMPYALWSQILYGLLSTPILYFIYKLVWPKFPEELEDAQFTKG